MSEINRGFHPEEFKNTNFEKVELKKDIVPIRAEIVELDSKNEALEAYHQSKEESDDYSVNWVDFDDFDLEESKAEGFKHDGPESYLISPIDEKDWFSDHYIDCTAVVGMGRDAQSGKEISFLSHQDPKYFVRGNDEKQKKFSQDLEEVLRELKARSEENTVEVSLLGGNYNPQQIKNDDYKQSIEKLREIVHDSLGFDPKVLVGPNSTGSETIINVETQQRKVWIERQKQMAEFDESYQANDFDEMEKKWIEKSPVAAQSEQEDENLFPAKKLKSVDERRESGPEVIELQNMFDEFEAKYPLQELYAITDLELKDVANHPLRYPAKNDLLLIFNKLRSLEDETKLTPDEQSELQARYANLADAVGYFSNGKITHSNRY